MTGTPTYQAWNHMKHRCHNSNTKDYRLWGGRGIAVCDRWRNSFDNFLADMGVCPSGMLLERKDNYGDYEPGNCVWATRTSQNRNKRNNKLTLADAKVIKKSTEKGVVLAARYGVNKATISAIRKERIWKDA